MIQRTFDEHIKTIERLRLKPQSALEVGAKPDKTAILAHPILDEAPNKIGINLRERGHFNGLEVRLGDARDLDFPNESFDLVVSASTLEHIPEFWLAVKEMHRVLRPGGHMIVAVPGYDDCRTGRRARRWGARLGLPDIMRRGTVTMRIHEAPYDFYRFSPFAMREIVMQDMEDVEVWSIMMPPRLYAAGRKAAR